MVLVALAASLAMVELDGEDTSPASATEALSFALPDAKGRPVELWKLQGKVVVVNFWATWCGPCRVEIPGFLRVYEKYGKDGLEIVGVSLDHAGPDVVEEFVGRYKISYPVVMVTPEIRRYYEQRFGRITGIPTTFFIDRQGRVVKRHVGYLDEARFEEAIKSLL